MASVPVITVDGPSGTGKGTIAQKLATYLGWHYLDSGALYRATAWAVLDQGVDIDDVHILQQLLDELSISTQAAEGQSTIICQGQDISVAIRSEAVGIMASRISSKSMVRKALFDLQLSARQHPGLVADGRDMGTVVFKDAINKFFLNASASERANRRYKQLQENGISGNLAQIEADLIKRDQRDLSRSLSPTVPASGAIIIDTTRMKIQQVMEEVIAVVDAA